MGQNRLMCPQCYAWPLNATGYLMIKTESSQEWELQQEKKPWTWGSPTLHKGCEVANNWNINRYVTYYIVVGGSYNYMPITLPR